MGKKAEPKQNYASRIYDWQLQQIPTDDETHDKLIHAFQQYYIANLQWIQTGTKRSAIDTRYWLIEIRNLVLDRRKIILEWLKHIEDHKDEKTFKPRNKRKTKKMLKLQGKADIQDE